MYLSSLDEVTLAAFVHLQKLVFDSLLSINNKNISLTKIKKLLSKQQLIKFYLTLKINLYLGYCKPFIIKYVS